ncbi:MAG: hypothetical protein IPM27_05405 [Nitrosomonadales bacterium]|nr:hypothetical protein [Nitrosomonadales bacterium]
MSDFLAWALGFKPAFLPKWIFLLLLAAFLLVAFCVLLVGLWFMSTQIDML